MSEYTEDMSWFKEKKVVIYGTGINAKNLIPVLLSQKANIVGVMDKDKWLGELERIKIITWDDIKPGEIDAIIIAAADRNVSTIYYRIKYRCECLGVQVFSKQGINLSEKYRYNNFKNKRDYYSKNYNQLCAYIDKHEVVSFDIFDTLIMRRVWEPTDIFDLVDLKIRERGIIIEDFKKERHMAEIETNCARLDLIYKHLVDAGVLDAATCDTVMEIEIATEKEYLIPRQSMLQALDYAVSQGKEVYLISDMYMSTDIMREILDANGIRGYKSLYISCECKAFKAGGLYDIVREENNIKGSWLHIGDDEFIDGIEANKAGIDFYIIKSSRDMLRVSSLEKLMLYSLNKKDKYLLGEIVAELFADPFALHESCGLVNISSLRGLTKLYYTSMACAYMEQMLNTLSKGVYDKILFLARDGYVFKKIYEQCSWIKARVENVYLYSSRRLNLLSTTYDEADVDRIGNHYGYETNSEDFWKKMTDGLTDYQEILNYCECTREGYMKYFEDNNLCAEKKYLICDLLSSGTIHKSLNELLGDSFKGFYLHKTDDVYDKGLDVDAVFGDITGESVKQYIYILENVFTAVEPSVKGCTDGKIEFLEDRRTKKQIEMLKQIQEQIVNDTVEYLSTWEGDDSLISADFLNSIIGLCQECEYTDDAFAWVYQKITDDLVDMDKDIV